MKETMIKKVAEAAALRMAFPDDLGGTYINEEMAQADADKPVIGNRLVMAEQPEEGDGQAPTDGIWRFPGGSLNGKSLKHRKFTELTIEEHRAFIEKSENYSKSKGKPLPEWWDDYLAVAEPEIANAELEAANV
jgi:hypothetical protein